MARPAYKRQPGPKVVSQGSASRPKPLPRPRLKKDPVQGFRRVTNPTTIV